MLLRLGATWGFRRRGVQKLEDFMKDVIVLNQARLHVSVIGSGDADERVDGVDNRPALNIDFDGSLSATAKQL